MWTSMWFSSVLAILVADITTGALQNKEIYPQRCYQCLNANTSTTCTQQKLPITCPAEEPFCGTVAVGPNFAALLKCLPAFKHPCSMKFTTTSTLELSCVCSGILCNAPFSKTIQNRLLQFAKTETVDNSSDITNSFFQYLDLKNATDLYKIITTDVHEVAEISTPSYAKLSTVSKLIEVPTVNLNNSNEIDIPHAEPLKHEATVPPDDDEDETEGSGSYEDTKSQKIPASAPAAPSSYLPAEENKASQIIENTLCILTLIMYSIL